MRKIAPGFSLLIICLLFISSNAFGGAKIKSSPPKATTGKKITFTYSNPETTECLVWDFGDGSKKQTLNSKFTISHSYKKDGRYRVKVWDQACDYGGPATASMTMVVRENARPAPVEKKKKGKISMKPRTPGEGETVTFAVKGFSSSCVTWDFGDGKKQKDTSPPAIKHNYDRPGHYTVTVYADCKKDVSGTAQIKIKKAVRSLLVDTKQIRVKEPVQFSTSGFVSDCIRWDFGEGPKKNGKSRASHTYKKPGKYQVKAYDYCGTKRVDSEKVTITVQEEEFKVNKVVLDLDSKNRNVVNIRQDSLLDPKATIHYEGKGDLKYQWYVDGKKFGPPQMKRLRTGRKVEVRLPEKLAAEDLGLHKISLKVVNFQQLSPVSYFKVRPLARKAALKSIDPPTPTLVPEPNIKPEIRELRRLTDPGHPANELWISYNVEYADKGKFEIEYEKATGSEKKHKTIPLKLFRRGSSDIIKIPVPKGKNVSFVKKITLEIEGDEQFLLDNTKDKKVTVKKTLMLGKDYFVQPLTVKKFKFWNGWFTYEFSHPVKRENISVTHLATGKRLNADDLDEHLGEDPSRSGIYELKGSSDRGVATARIGISFYDVKLQQWIDTALKYRCYKEGTEQKELSFPDLTRKKYHWTERVCGMIGKDPMYKKYQELLGKAGHPTIEAFRPVGGNLVNGEYIVEDGETVELFAHVADSPSKKLHRKVEVVLHENGKLISTWRPRGTRNPGDVPKNIDPDAVHSGGGYYATVTFKVKPKKEKNQYNLILDRGDGNIELETVQIRIKNPRPLISEFKADRPNILSGEKSTLKYKVSKADQISIHEIDNLSGTPIEIRKIDLLEDKIYEGKISVHPRETTTYLLSASGALGTPVKTTKITVQGMTTKMPALPYVKLVAEPKTINKGEKAKLHWGFMGAKTVYLHLPPNVVIPLFGNKSGDGQSSMTVTPRKTTTYSIEVIGLNGKKKEYYTTIYVK